MEPVGAGSGVEAARHVDELGDADALEPAAERQVFAERHQVALVVALRQQSAPVERQDRIEEMPAAVAAVVLVEPRRAGDERRPAAQELADRRQRRAVAREQEGKGRFRPDQMGDVGDAGGRRRGRPVGKGEVFLDDRLPVVGRKIAPLRDVGLHQPHLDVGQRRARRRRNAPGAEGEDRRERERRRAQSAASVAASRSTASPARRRSPRPEASARAGRRSKRSAPVRDWRPAPCRARSTESR